MNFIDLFAGAGGMSEGFIKAGFNPLIHIEKEKEACLTLETRTAYYFLKREGLLSHYWDYVKGDITATDLRSFVPEELVDSVFQAEINHESIQGVVDHVKTHINGQKVDVIIGGPPCQAYSMIGRSRDPKGMKGDKRNYLFKQYADFLASFKPKLFVFENVTGLLSAGKGEYLRKLYSTFYKAGYETEYRVLNAKDFGVPQSRKRVILIGWEIGAGIKYPDFQARSFNGTINELFDDLPILRSGDKIRVHDYTTFENSALDQMNIRNGTPFASQNYTHRHNPRDLEIYRLVAKKWIFERKRMSYNELPNHLITHKNRSSFLDRFKVVDGKGLSHTVVAHLGKDGHYFIHPSLAQNRSISTREAARIQSFPDDYYFEGGMGKIFRQIGNAVPPQMAKGIAEEIKKLLN